MREFGIGIIGCGVISSIYMQNMPLFAGLRLRACADLRPQAAAAQAATFGIQATSLDDILRHDDIDIIVNLTIPTAHAEVSQAALAAGKHVFSEKPLAAAVEDGRVIVSEAERRGLLLGCAPDTFLGGGGRLARQMVDAGKVGRILSGSACLMSHGMEHWHPDPGFFYRPGGGPILDMGPYYISALVNLLGPVAHVQALTGIGFAERAVTAPGPQMGKSIRVETPTTILALLAFAGGAQLSLALSWDVWRHGQPAIELHGTEGSMRVPDPNFFGGSVEFTQRDGAWQPESADRMPLGIPNYRHPSWQDDQPSLANYRCLGLAELASAAALGTPHRSSGRFALHVLEVMHGILQAGATGEGVSIATQIERPPALEDSAAQALLRPS